VNAAIGLWTSQSLFQLVRHADSPVAHRQLLMGGFTPTQVSVGLSMGLLVFFAGLLYWGGRFRTLRRTTIILAGIMGGAFAIGCTFVVNHTGGAPLLVLGVFVLGAAIGLFVLAGATPAALGLLADVSEGHPQDRGTIMGLYSVFLALGQVTGSLVGGSTGCWRRRWCCWRSP
jgi:MFS family permease